VQDVGTGQQHKVELLKHKLERMSVGQNALRRSLIETNEQLLRRDRELQVEVRDALRLRDEELERLRGALAEHEAYVAELERLQATRAWRFAKSWWAFREKLRRASGH
jgi:hypothetical protein